MAVKVASRSASPTGTFTVELFNSTGSLSVATVVVDVADVPLVGGWFVLPIGSTLLLAATNYQIRVKTGSASMVTLYRDSTATNWSRQLRTTTTQAPAAGDKLIVAGEHTGSGTGNNFVVTMNETATTTYGAVAFAQSVTVNKRATLQYGTAASTNYYLRVKGIFKVWDSGTFTIGTTGTPMPSTSTAVLEFDATAAVDSGLIIGSGATFTAQGNALTYDRAFLAADAAAAATVLTTDVSTGWLSGDVIGLFPTARTVTQSEQATLSINAAGTTVTITAGLTYAHNGTSSYAHGEVINLTRNVKIRGISASLTGYMSIGATAVVDLDWVEFAWLGNATAATSAIFLNTTTGSFNMQRCSLHDFTIASTAAIRSNVADITNITISYNVMYIGAFGVYFTGASTITNAITLDNNWITTIASGYCIYLSSNTTAIVTNNRTSGGTTGINYLTCQSLPLQLCDSNVSHANNNGIGIDTCNNGTVSNNSTFRNNGIGLQVFTSNNMLISSHSSVGNTSGGFQISDVVDSFLTGLTSKAESGFTTGYGIYAGQSCYGTIVASSTFGGSASEDATNSDIVLNIYLSYMLFHNCTFNSPTELLRQSGTQGTSFRSQKHQGTADNNKWSAWEGLQTLDTTIFNTSSPSLRMAPSYSYLKLKSVKFSAAVANGATLTPSVTVRKSVAGDGTAYNGNQPRLVLRANPAAGITADTVLATAAAAAGTWETLSGTTAAVTENTRLEFYVDCDGTTGWVNVDNAILPSFTSGFNTWSDGVPIIQGSSGAAVSGETSATFIA